MDKNEHRNFFENGPLDKNITEDLDTQLIKELNLQYDDDDLPEAIVRKRTKFHWRVTAALIFIIFTLFLLGNWLKIFTWLPLADWDKWSPLSETPEMQILKQPVVHIKARGNILASDAINTGTGFNIAPEGLIITNRHIVKNAADVRVYFPGKGSHKAAKCLCSEVTDLALIKLDLSNLPAVTLADKDFPIQGEDVTIIGNPRGLDRIVVQGNITDYWNLESMQKPIMGIDAPIQPGNSGSPVYNSYGQVVGVIFAHVYDKDSENIKALAIPVPHIYSFLKDINMESKINI